MGNGSGLANLEVVMNKQRKWALKRETRKGYTLDIDASQIVAEKHAAHYTYKKEKGYMPSFWLYPEEKTFSLNDIDNHVKDLMNGIMPAVPDHRTAAEAIPFITKAMDAA